MNALQDAAHNAAMKVWAENLDMNVLKSLLTSKTTGPASVRVDRREYAVQRIANGFTVSVGNRPHYGKTVEEIAAHIAEDLKKAMP